jgi:O-antigen/teichoic acid export membrane protein
MAKYSFDTNHLKLDIKKRAVKGSGATVISSAVSFLVQLVGTIVLARLLTPEDYGLVAMVTTFSLLLQNFGFNGFTEAIIQREEINHNIINTLFWINGGMSFALTLLFVALSPLVARFYREPRLTLISAAIAVSIISSGVSTIHVALLNRNMRFYVLSFIGVITKLICMIVTIFLAWIGLKYWALVVNTIALPLITAAGAWLVCRWRPSRPSRGTDVKPMVKYALHTYGKFTLGYCSRNLDNLLVGKYLGFQLLGYYKKAYDLFALSAGSLIAPLSNVALAALSRFSSDYGQFRRHFLNAISRIAFVSIALSLVLTVAAKDIILLMLGPKWGQSAEIFIFFGPGVGLMLIYYTHGWLHLSLGRPDRWFRWGILEFIVTASFIVVGLFFGPKGVAAAWSLSFFVLTGPGLWYAGRPVDLKISSLFSTIGRYFAAALGAGLLSWFILFSWSLTANIFGRFAIFFRVVVASSLCLSLYVLLTILFFRSFKPIKQFFSLAKEMLPGSMPPSPVAKTIEDGRV